MLLGGQDCDNQCSLETLYGRSSNQCDSSSNQCDSETWVCGFVTNVPRTRSVMSGEPERRWMQKEQGHQVR